MTSMICYSTDAFDSLHVCTFLLALLANLHVGWFLLRWVELNSGHDHITRDRRRDAARRVSASLAFLAVSLSIWAWVSTIPGFLGS